MSMHPFIPFACLLSHHFEVYIIFHIKHDKSDAEEPTSYYYLLTKMISPSRTR